MAQIKGFFICDFCRNICEGKCFEQLKAINDGTVKEGDEEYEKNKDLIGRKHIITCLGKYCDRPCKYQKQEYTPFNEKDDNIAALYDELINQGYGNDYE